MNLSAIDIGYPAMGIWDEQVCHQEYVSMSLRGVSYGSYCWAMTDAKDSIDSLVKGQCISCLYMQCRRADDVAGLVAKAGSFFGVDVAKHRLWSFLALRRRSETKMSGPNPPAAQWHASKQFSEGGSYCRMDRHVNNLFIRDIFVTKFSHQAALNSSW